MTQPGIRPEPNPFYFASFVSFVVPPWSLFPLLTPVQFLDFPETTRRIFALSGTILSVMTTQQRSPSNENPLSGPDWGAVLGAHEDWLRKVILARTGEPQAVDEVF